MELLTFCSCLNPITMKLCFFQVEKASFLYEAGDYKSIPRHKDSRLHDPAKDIGKTNLAPGLRNRFTELYCDEMGDQADITMLVTDYLENFSRDPVICEP